MARPGDFAPAFGATDAVGPPTDPLQERIEVGVAIVGAGPGGLACAIRLGQLLDNLLSNAVKFSNPGGRVVVALGRSGKDLVLAVSDNGIGIPAAEHRLLFDRFFRASSAQQRAIDGTGLGLTIARAIVSAHGGAIELTSAEGEGTTFRVRLPVAGPKKAQRSDPVDRSAVTVI